MREQNGIPKRIIYIKYHDFGFKIGILEGQGTECFCSRIEIDKKLNFIDFNDVLTNKKQNNVSKISKELEKITNRIEKAYRSGVPIEAIKNVVETVLDETYEKQEIKRKSLQHEQSCFFAFAVLKLDKNLQI